MVFELLSVMTAGKSAILPFFSQLPHELGLLSSPRENSREKMRKIAFSQGE